MAIPGNSVAVMDPFAQALASFPSVPRKITGDGVQPGATPKPAQSVDPGVDPGAEPAQQIKTLDQAQPADQYKTIDALVKSQDRLRKNRYAIDLYHTWLDENVQFGYLDKIPNQNVWIAKLAPGINTERESAVPNKAADLCTKVADALLADPPKP